MQVICFMDVFVPQPCKSRPRPSSIMLGFLATLSKRKGGAGDDPTARQAHEETEEEAAQSGARSGAGRGVGRDVSCVRPGERHPTGPLKRGPAHQAQRLKAGTNTCYRNNSSYFQ